jgi:diacylglycerol kinase family enzyme
MDKLKDPGDMVAVAGGDGTVRRVATHLIGRRIPIAILPAGTANNIAHTLGIDGSFEELIASWHKSSIKEFDVGLASAGWGNAHFIEGMGVGLFSKTMSMLSLFDEQGDEEFESADDKMERDLKALKGILRDYRAQTLELELDGKDLSGEYLLVEAMNINYVGPNLYLGPASDPRDGYLDFILVPEEKREALGDYLVGRLEGKQEPPHLDFERGKHLSMRFNDMEMHVDDKMWGEAEFGQAESGSSSRQVVDIRVSPGALNFLACQ